MTYHHKIVFFLYVAINGKISAAWPNILDLRWEYLSAYLYIVTSVLNEWRSHNVNTFFFVAKTDKTLVAVKWRIIDFQQTWGSCLGTLPGYIFMPTL